MGRKRQILKNIWERDEGRCGIHLSGCGESVDLNEAEIGHIVPKAMMPAQQYDNYIAQTVRKGLRAEKGVELGRYWNTQPMHRECNDAMRAIWPPQPIHHVCECCQYVYVVETRNNSVRPIEWWMGNELPESPEGAYLLMRTIQHGKDGIKRLMFARGLGQTFSMAFSDGRRTERALLVTARLGKHKVGAEMGKAGRMDLTLREMQTHNAQYPTHKLWRHCGRLEILESRADVMEPRQRRPYGGV